MVIAVRPDEFEPRKPTTDAIEDKGGTVPILHTCRMHDDPHRQALSVDKGMQLAPLHLLGGIVADRVVLTAPFPADFSVWLSIIAAEGLALRSSRSHSASVRLLGNPSPSRR